MAYTAKQLTLAWTAVHGGVEPDANTLADLQNRAAQNAAGALSDAQALGFVLNSADSGAALAALSYQFFTGKSPTKDGLAYLVHSDANANDLSDAYYDKFSLENRYINFAVNLGVQGEGKDAFAAKYGAMSFADYVASIYESIIGKSYATAAGIDPAKAIADITSRQAALLATAQSAGMITPGMSQAQIDLAVKAAAAGYLLGEAIKADVGLYAAAANNFMLAVATGTATYNTDLTTTYKPTADQGIGQAVTAPPPVDTVPGYVPPPPPPPPPSPPAPTPQSFTLTTGADTFTGQGAGDTFTGVATYIGVNQQNTSTLNAATDALDGAGGYDTLSLTISGSSNPSLTIDPTKVRNIERLLITGAVASSTVTLSPTNSFTELVITGNTGSTTFTGYGNNVTKLGVSNQRLGTVKFAVDTTTLIGANDALTVTLTDQGTSSTPARVDISVTGTNYYETLNIVSNGTANYVNLPTGSTQTSLTRVNISGAAPLTLATFTAGLGDKFYLATTIDASAATGGVTIGAGTGTTGLGLADQTVILGTGANLVNFGANGGVSNLDANDTVDGSRGTNDTIAIIATNGITSAALAHVTGIENFRFNPNGSGITQDTSQLPTGVGLQVGGSFGTVTLTNLANNAAVDVFKANSALTLAMQLANNGGGSTDAMTLRFNAAGGVGAALGVLSDITGLETLNIVSNGTGTNTINDDRVTARHVVTGSTDLSLTFGSVTGPVTVDGSAFTGKLDITGPSGQSLTVIGGTGKDSFSGAGGSQFILGVQGQNFQSGADVISARGTGGTIAFVGNVAAGTGAATDLLGGVSISDGSGNVTGVILTFSADDHDFSLKNAAGTAFTGLAKGAVAQGLTAGDTPVVQNLGPGSGAIGATANVSLITASAAAFTTDIKTLFQTAFDTDEITGLAADGNYLVSVYDTTHNRTVVAVVNTGASGAGDTTLSAADFTDSGVALIGYIYTASLLNNVSQGTAF